MAFEPRPMSKIIANLAQITAELNEKSARADSVDALLPVAHAALLLDEAGQVLMNAYPRSGRLALHVLATKEKIFG